MKASSMFLGVLVAGALLVSLNVNARAGATLPFSDDFESYAADTTGTTSIVGLGDWIAPAEGSGPADPSNGAPGRVIDASVYGAPAGPGGVNALGGFDNAPIWQGGAVSFDPISTGIVDITYDVGTGGTRKHLYLFGDGNTTDTKYSMITMYPYVFDKIFWTVNDGVTAVGGSSPFANPPTTGSWLRMHYQLDFDNNTMLAEWWDINDTTGAQIGSVNPIFSGVALPFTSFTYLSAVQNHVIPFLDNVVVTPEPASLALLVLGGAAVLGRRRRYRRAS